MRARPAAIAALLAAASLAGGAAPAAAQEPDPGAQPAPPGPAAPDLVISGRNVRMTRGNVVGIRMGCRGTAAQAGEACIGSVTLRLAGALEETFDPPGPREQATRRVNPFNFAIRDFTLNVGDATRLRMRLSRRAADLVRRHERIRVDVIVAYNGRSGAAGTARRNVRVYFPKRPGL